MEHRRQDFNDSPDRVTQSVLSANRRSGTACLNTAMIIATLVAYVAAYVAFMVFVTRHFRFKALLAKPVKRAHGVCGIHGFNSPEK